MASGDVESAMSVPANSECHVNSPLTGDSGERQSAKSGRECRRRSFARLEILRVRFRERNRLPFSTPVSLQKGVGDDPNFRDSSGAPSSCIPVDQCRAQYESPRPRCGRIPTVLAGQTRGMVFPDQRPGQRQLVPGRGRRRSSCVCLGWVRSLLRYSIDDAVVERRELLSMKQVGLKRSGIRMFCHNGSPQCLHFVLRLFNLSIESSFPTGSLSVVLRTSAPHRGQRGIVPRFFTPRRPCSSAISSGFSTVCSTIALLQPGPNLAVS